MMPITIHMRAPKKDALDRSWNLLFLLEEKTAINITNPTQPREDREIGEKINEKLNLSANEIGKIKIKPNVVNIVQG